MDQRGFGKVEVIGFLSVVALSMLIIWLLVKQISDTNPGGESPSFSKAGVEPVNGTNFEPDTYAELEHEISLKSQHYFDNNQTDEIQIVTLLKLIQNNYIPQIYSLKNHDVLCTGYVEYVRSEDTPHTYLKCDDEYTTKGYQLAKDN